MAKKLFVGGLSYEIEESALKEIFAKIGEVTSCMIIKDKMTGRSKGFGFVEMVNDADAEKAIETLNGTELEGRKITVNEARPMEERPRRDFGSNRNFGGDRDRNR